MFTIILLLAMHLPIVYRIPAPPHGPNRTECPKCVVVTRTK
jgi:hypothetical protein